MFTYGPQRRVTIPQAAILPTTMPQAATFRSRNAPAQPRELPAGPGARLDSPPGTRIGRWQLVRRVAGSEHADIHLARPVDRPVDGPADYLLKVPRSSGPGELAAALLRREVAVAGSVRHSNVAAVLGADLSHSPGSLVLANIGVPLGDQPRQSLRSALWRTRQVAAALAALHAAGWIHSRVTPQAVFVSSSGHATLSDLGWSRRVGTEECRGEHLLAVDLRYVAPEMLCDASTLTPESDVYALGLLLIELLIGRPAVNAQAGWQAGLAHLRGELADVRQFRVDVPPAAIDLLSRMTSREPLRRPSAAEVGRQLVRLEVAELSGERASRTRWR